MGSSLCQGPWEPTKKQGCRRGWEGQRPVMWSSSALSTLLWGTKPGSLRCLLLRVCVVQDLDCQHPVESGHWAGCHPTPPAPSQEAQGCVVQGLAGVEEVIQCE